MAIEQLLQPRQSGLPPQMMALLELEQAKQALMQSGVAPGTVAGQKIQEAQMLTQPQQPQADLQNLIPGIQQRAGQMAQAQQPVTQAQLQQAMAQRAAPGIAGLPADVNMAEGGIVGYNGEERSDVELPVNERIKKAYRDYLAARERGEPLFRRSGAEALEDLLRGRPAPEAQRLTPEAPVVPEATSAATRQGKSGIAEQDIGEVMRSMAAPRPAPSSRPPAALSAAPAAAPTSPLQQYQTAAQTAIQEALSPLKEAQKKRELTPEELAFVKRQEENLLRSRERLAEQERRFLDLERLREEAGKTTGLQDLAAFLSRAGGARSLFAGLGQAARTQADIDAARRKEAQAAIDRKRQYFDLLEDRKDAIEQRDLAIQQGRMDRARAEQDRIDAVNRALAQTTGTLEAQRLQGLASIMGHQITAEEAAKSRGQASRQADEAKMLALLGRLDQAKLEDLRKIEADHVKDPKYRMVYTMAATGAKLTPDQEAQLRAADAALEAKKAEVFKSINPRISQLESRVFGDGAKNIDLSKWGEPQVKSGR